MAIVTTIVTGLSLVVFSFLLYFYEVFKLNKLIQEDQAGSEN